MKLNGSEKYKLDTPSGTTARGIWPVVQKYYASLTGGTKWPPKLNALVINNYYAVNSTTIHIDYDNDGNVYNTPQTGAYNSQIQVYKDGVPWFVANNSGSRYGGFSHGGLTPNTTYSFTIAFIEIDKAYPSTMSGAVSITTCPAYGTPAGDVCNGYTLYSGISNGNCGVEQSNWKQNNSPSCGFFDQNGGISVSSYNYYGAIQAIWLWRYFYYDSSGNGFEYSYCNGDWNFGDNKYGCYQLCFGALCSWNGYCWAYMEVSIDGSVAWIEDHMNSGDFGFMDMNYPHVCNDYNTCPAFCI